MYPSMKTSITWSLILAALISVPIVLSAAPCTANPAIDVVSRVERVKARRVRVVSPYTVNVYALHLLNEDHPGNRALVKAYLDWYLRHLNYPDRWGLTGTIYDYRIQYRAGARPRETPLRTYDSADAYAGTFLLLFSSYVLKSRDRAFMEEHIGRLKDVAYVIVRLVDPDDGLTVALPGKKTKYLMDNAEAYAGLLYFTRLLALNVSSPGDKRDLRYYRAFDTRLKQGILAGFYNADKGYFYWAIDDGVKSRPDLKVFYPDLLSQAYPYVYCIKRPDRLYDTVVSEIERHKLTEAQSIILHLTLGCSRTLPR